jgi:hypothetical protein
MAKELGFASWQREDIFLLFIVSQLALGPTLLPIKHTHLQNIINTVNINTLQNTRVDQTWSLTAATFLFHYN